MKTKVILVLGLLALGGCGGGGGDDQPTAAAASADPALAYSQCMRQNGVPSFPDPQNGRLIIKVEKGTDLDPDSPALKKAQEACKALEPPGLKQGQGGAGQAQLLKYVQCMRSHGVPDMPDPQPDGKMLIGGPDSGVDPESQVFKDAQTACRDQMPGGMG